ncbi:NAD-dependent epimerase/dehydratase family protein [Paenibacillus nanensis]|uniref:NAD-dependent epimerase/dehydratase family protein n=1 Tax=Paenibacillus nanensis TaxID=393251 RepID=A0A3A1UIG4_9BACL|nr:NAD-dependent epimerase/dehydratase family protein [Paenibacillus nanensis]RIX45876.1 NAD-dependent epimerase/dehydratase family protein [Paenibacillus nanensis]
MKRILITGVGSYVGMRVKRWLENYPDKYRVETISLRDPSWKDKKFTSYDVIFHVAGIAHVSTDPSMEDLYYAVNRDLTYEIALKAKAEGVRHFIFMSSIIVYGDGNGKTINHLTLPTPSNFYGKSKLQAEEAIRSIEDDKFRVAIIRAPMIYGKGNKGNYQKLSRIAQKTIVFPDFENERSMLHIDNLCEFVRHLVDFEDAGIYYPQNRDYVKTTTMCRLIAEMHGKKIRFTRVFNPLISLGISRLAIVNKVFGNLAYEKEMSNYKAEYCIRDFEESIKLTEL